MNADQAKALFFDKKAVTDRLDPAVRRALSKLGAFVRTRAKSSVRYGKGAARPGAPPVAHRSAGYTRTSRSRKTGQTKQQPASPLRELIYFAYDPASRSVVVGPTLGGSQSGAPARLEFGRGVAPHPFMRPALEAERAKAPDLFRGMIR